MTVWWICLAVFSLALYKALCCQGISTYQMLHSYKTTVVKTKLKYMRDSSEGHIYTFIFRCSQTVKEPNTTQCIALRLDFNGLIV